MLVVSSSAGIGTRAIVGLEFVEASDETHVDVERDAGGVGARENAIEQELIERRGERNVSLGEQRAQLVGFYRARAVRVDLEELTVLVIDHAEQVDELVEANLVVVVRVVFFQEHLHSLTIEFRVGLAFTQRLVQLVEVDVAVLVVVDFVKENSQVFAFIPTGKLKQ